MALKRHLIAFSILNEESLSLITQNKSMKINLLMISVTALAATLFAACHNHEHEAEDHDHAHESREADKHGDEQIGRAHV